MARKPARKKPRAQGDGHGSRRPEREVAFIAALLISPSLAAAAASVGIGLRTAQRWHAEPAFKARLEAAQGELVTHSLMRLKTSASAAINVLNEIIRDTNVSAPARVAAARTLIDGTFKAVEVSDVLTRLERLEQAENERNGNQQWA
jgi:hypothetical protein